MCLGTIFLLKFNEFESSQEQMDSNDLTRARHCFWLSVFFFVVQDFRPTLRHAHAVDETLDS